jgi:hypothetical protein
MVGAAIHVEVFGLRDGDLGSEHGPEFVISLIVEFDGIRPQPVLDPGSVAADLEIRTEGSLRPPAALPWRVIFLPMKRSTSGLEKLTTPRCSNCGTSLRSCSGLRNIKSVAHSLS